MKKLVTHPNGFHSDDIMAYAILQEVLAKRGEGWVLERSRDPEVIASADIVFDVGEVYDPAINRYDHHQRGRAGARDNGVLYASAGLVWKHFGRELCSSEAVWDLVDKYLIMEIDAGDNGQDYYSGELKFENSGATNTTMHLAYFSPTMFEPHSPEILLEKFTQASEFARGMLMRAIIHTEAGEQAFKEATDVYNNSTDKQILVFEKNYERPTWRRLAELPEVIFAIYQDKTNQWRAEAIPKERGTMESRVYFPEAWRGLRADELQAITGVSDAHFCHPSGFLMGAASKESILKLAKMAISM